MINLSMSIANDSDIDKVNQLFEEVKRDLLEKKLFQWDENYPNRGYIEYVIRESELYVFREKEEIVGAVVLNEWQSEEWDTIPWSRQDGKWLIIHSLCVHPSHQGKGFARVMMDFCEEYAVQQNYDGIRLDAFSENDLALKLYEKRGYQRLGEIIFESKPINHQVYYCYEKLIG